MNCPETSDMCGISTEYIEWKLSYREDERDLYMAACCLLATGLNVAICYYKNRFDSYVQWNIRRQEEEEKKNQ